MARALATCFPSLPRRDCTGLTPRNICATSFASSASGRATATSNWRPSTGPPHALGSILSSLPTRSAPSRFRPSLNNRRHRADCVFASTPQNCALQRRFARRGPCIGYPSRVEWHKISRSSTSRFCSQRSPSRGPLPVGAGRQATSTSAWTARPALEVNQWSCGGCSRVPSCLPGSESTFLELSVTVSDSSGHSRSHTHRCPRRSCQRS